MEFQRMLAAFTTILWLTCSLASRNVEHFINEINIKQNLWTAGRNFNGALSSELRGLLGFKKLPENLLKTVPVMKHNLNVTEIPEHFDARIQWPECKSIKEVKDQSACSSCWSVATTSVISDRICIHSNGSLQPEISAKYLMACSKQSFGCGGGYPYFAFLFWKTNGLVTGGPFGSNIGCQPYPFAPCEHFIEGPKVSCPKTDYKSPVCVNTCDNSSLVFSKELFFGHSVYRLSSESQTQVEIMKNGPVTAAFYVFEDFLLYKSGVYIQTAGHFGGAHAVRLIGWGVENGTKYWLAMNSWNEDWGDKGLFKIRRGSNECGIEDEVYAGIPK